MGGGGAVWGDAAGKFVRGGVGARGGDFIVLLQRQNVVSHGDGAVLACGQ